MNVLVGLLLIGVFNFVSPSTETYSSARGWEKTYAGSDWTPMIPLHRYGDKVYYMGIQFTATWYQALDFCEKIHMTLLTIRSEDENNRILKYIKEASRGTEYWIGGSRLIDGNTWLWMALGETINYTNWSIYQPSTLSEQCLQLWVWGDRLEWNDRHCDTQFHFICERTKEQSSNKGGL